MNIDALFHRDSLIPRVTPLACLACVIVFLGLQFGGDKMTWAQSAKWGYYPASAVWEGKPWMLVTSTFVHFEIWHIFFNVYWLWILGNILEDEIGPLWWLVFFVGAAWVSSSFQLLVSGDTGIGMSGVGYALFGFGWIARHKMRVFSLILTQQTIVTFLLWLVGCFIATELGLANIGNMAHLAGLAFGAAVAGVFVERWRLPLSVPGLVVLCLASFITLFWCPQSGDWVGIKATDAAKSGRTQEAIYWYQYSIRRDQDPVWAWSNLAGIYADAGDKNAYQDAVKHLRTLDEARANEVVADDVVANKGAPESNSK